MKPVKMLNELRYLFKQLAKTIHSDFTLRSFASHYIQRFLTFTLQLTRDLLIYKFKNSFLFVIFPKSYFERKKIMTS